jgi:FtsP/CotA-like multicopper oxidase with cupredoxin domain
MSVRSPNGVAPDVSPTPAHAPLRRHLADLLPLGAAFGLLAVLGVAACAPAAAPTGGPGAAPAPLAGVPLVLEAFPQPKMISSVDGTLNVELSAEFDSIYVPTKGRWWLRTYRLLSANGVSYADSNVVGFPGPTFRVAPGDRVRILLRNNLPWTDADTSHTCEPYAAALAGVDVMPNCFHRPNWTNIHYHGLHVTPNSPGDNVLMEIAPDSTFQFDFRIPQNQSPGTHWYHPHKHGAVAVQVLNGMSGAFLVVDTTTGIDSVSHALKMREFVMAIQQINQQLNLTTDAFGTAGPFVNGASSPVLTLAPGEVARLRIVNENVHSNAQYSLVIRDPDLALFDIARDGVAYDSANYDHVNRDTTLNLSPGNRLDVFVRAPAYAGTFDVHAIQPVSGRERLNHAVRDTVPPLQPLFRIRVAPTLDIVNTILPSTLPPLPPFLRNLPAPDGGTAVVVFSDSGFADKTHQRPTEFWLGNAQNPRMRMSSDVFIPTSADGAQLPMRLGQTQSWVILNYSTVHNHPFHIHINPFQVDSIYAPSAVDTVFGNYYAWMNEASGVRNRPLWLDVLPLPLATTDSYGNLVPGRAVIRQRYDDFAGCTDCGSPAGRFVIHCHILGHEERGMMQMIQIFGPGESVPAASAAGGHHHH